MIHVNREFDEVASREKYERPRSETIHEIHHGGGDESENASGSIRHNGQFDLKLIAEDNGQTKQDESRISTLARIIIHWIFGSFDS
jgi:hypothetical protein